jgi:hypothetical protein
MPTQPEHPGEPIPLAAAAEMLAREGYPVSVRTLCGACSRRELGCSRRARARAKWFTYEAEARAFALRTTEFTRPPRPHRPQLHPLLQQIIDGA